MIDIADFLLTLLFVSFILRSKKTPGNTSAWLLFIALVPYVGIPFYIIFSHRKFRTKLWKKNALFQPIVASQKLDTIERILETIGAPPARRNIEARLILSGTDAYNEISKLIQGAQKNIYLTTFIFANDLVGRSILDLLTKKAEEGIKVRLLLDSLGSLWTRHPSLRAFKKAGGKIAYFMPLFHFSTSGRSNLRNHRKMLIIDSRLAIFGGMNIAQEYMGPDPKFHFWIDLGVKIEGPSVSDIESIFVKDWEFATKEIISTQTIVAQNNANDNRLQIIASGPDVLGDPLYDSILTLIFKAKNRLWIATPYFIPDESLAKALQLAAQRGVDIRILVPKKSNHLLADLARGTYLKQLIPAGCKIYFYPEMMHAKVFLIDEEYSLVGSANFDMRSLLYNFEVGAILYSSLAIHKIEAWFLENFHKSVANQNKTGIWIELVEGIGRVLGPLI